MFNVYVHNLPHRKLGRVLSLDEMKSIFGGSNATITCMCTMSVQRLNETTGQFEIKPETHEPTGKFYTEDFCKEACQTTCEKLPYKCIDFEAHFNFSMGSGSGS